VTEAELLARLSAQGLTVHPGEAAQVLAVARYLRGAVSLIETADLGELPHPIPPPHGGREVPGSLNAPQDTAAGPAPAQTPCAPLPPSGAGIGWGGTTGTDLPTVAEMAATLRRGETTAEAILDLHLAAIAARDARTRAVWHLDELASRNAARAVDTAFARGEDPGPLAGIPVAIKDTIDVAGMPTTHGSALYGEIAAGDAPIVTILRQAGAIPLAKVATYDLGTVGPSFDLPHPPARNPWNPDHITGGSSSGSAAAVAGGLFRLALGSDTAGSIRAPAAYCGCVGLKPTRGSLRGGGVLSLAPTLDNLGPMGATVAETAALWDALTGQATDPSPHPLRVGYARDWFAQDPACHPDVIAALDAAAGAFTLAGAALRLVALPDYALMEGVGAVIIHHEGLHLHRPHMQARDHRHGAQSYLSMAAGAALDDGDAEAARALIGPLTEAVDRALDGLDVLITTTTLTPAAPFAAFAEGSVWTPMRTLPFNVTGHPAISLPCGFSGGLPLGLQIIGRHGDEVMLFRAAQAFEASTDHAAQRPQVQPLSA
jgi:aspartyl-tRNA(Asn)/glutamyl-tRNA(Gln) amidotransferase subunit A